MPARTESFSARAHAVHWRAFPWLGIPIQPPPFRPRSQDGNNIWLSDLCTCEPRTFGIWNLRRISSVSSFWWFCPRIIDGFRFLVETWWFSLIYQGNPSISPKRTPMSTTNFFGSLFGDLHFFFLFNDFSGTATAKMAWQSDESFDPLTCAVVRCVFIRVPYNISPWRVIVNNVICCPLSPFESQVLGRTFENLNLGFVQSSRGQFPIHFSHRSFQKPAISPGFLVVSGIIWIPGLSMGNYP